MILQSHPTGNANVRNSAIALGRAELLSEFWTCISWDPHSPLARLLPPSVARQFARRTFDPIIRSRAHTYPWREVARLFAPALKLGALTRHETGFLSVDAIFHTLDAKVAGHLSKAKSRGVRAVYAGEDGALSTFQKAQQLGLSRFYELPIAYWEVNTRLLREEALRWPEWEPTLVGTQDSQVKLERKAREMELAEVVIVPSQFVFDSLPEKARRDKVCKIVPFGSPVFERPSDDKARSEANRPLRVLFAGSMTQRKGLADLFAAMKLLNRSDVELVVMGLPMSPMSFYRAQYADFRYEAPRPHSEVLDLMNSCDVLALPSISEGRALVQQEAMACGLPLIVTANAGGEDLIDSGQTGFLVPIRSPEHIAEKLNWFAENRNLLPEMRRLAREKTALYTWQGYGSAIVNTFRAYMN